MRGNVFTRWCSFAVFSVVSVAAAVGPGTASAQDPGSSALGAREAANIGDPDLAPDGFGLQANIDFVSAEEFVCDDTTGNCDWSNCGLSYWCAWAESHYVEAAVEIPSGALMTGFRVLYSDTDAVYDLNVGMSRAYTDQFGQGETNLASWWSSGSPGYGDAYVDLSPDVTVVRRYSTGFMTHGYQSYVLRAMAPKNGGCRLRGVAVFWARQISPAPVDATFDDVPAGHWAFQHIEALSSSGITAGCGGGNFCPDSPLTRAQMAVFLAKALGLHWAY